MGAVQAARIRVEAGAFAAAAGDESAFAELTERYRRELQVHCYRMLGSFEESEDLVQETFLRAWRRRATFQGRSTFRAWLYAIATNACLDALERRPRPASARALQRARATMRERLPRRRTEWTPGSDPSEEERALLLRYVEAAERGDAAAMVELMREDAFFAMPPQAEWVVGNEAIVDAWVKGGFGSDSFGRLRCVRTRVNAQPAVAVYLRRPDDREYRPFLIDVLKIEGGNVTEITAFELDETLLDALGLPRTL